MDFNLHFDLEECSFKLVELPHDLCELIEASPSFTLLIKGDHTEDAVLCTKSKTYSARSVSLSNSVLIVTADDALAIRNQVEEIIELTPIMPRLHKLTALLKGRQYDDQEDLSVSGVSLSAYLTEQDTSKLTYNDARNIIQASDEELHHGLAEKRVLNINAELRVISPGYLDNLLQLFLTLLVAQSQSLDAVVVRKLTSALADDHDVPLSVSTQVMMWFGEIQDGTWKIDILSIVKEIGLSLLRHHKVRTKWLSIYYSYHAGQTNFVQRAIFSVETGSW
jgi:sister chromatid cohesion protein DCC1